MTITREQLGRLIGVIVLSLLIATLSWTSIAFVAWDFYPGHWPVWLRVGAVGMAIVLLFARILAQKLVIVEDVPDEEQR